MRVFHCEHCRLAVFFENALCSRCGNTLAYLPDVGTVATLERPDANVATYFSKSAGGESRPYRLCQNYTEHAACNWAVPDDDANPYCLACRLNLVVPDLSLKSNLDKWRRLELAKRRLCANLLELNLPLVDRSVDPVHGLAFRFLADPSEGPHVLTGHEDGVITLNIAEADDVERERMRLAMHEPYRTILGHLRHEIGHYYWDRLIANSARLDDFRALFGDEQLDYAQALQNHYSNGPNPDWPSNFVSEYASCHPWEDWAESFAHYLHITDTLDTAAWCGLSLHPNHPDEPSLEQPPTQPVRNQTFDQIIDAWFPLTYILNCLNRGMGHPDAYPFVLSAPTIEKLRFIHDIICSSTMTSASTRS